MDCQKIQKLIPIYLDQQLETAKHRQVEAHLLGCPDCRREARAIEQSWDLLGEIETLKPDPNYIARFWHSVDAQMPWHAKIFKNVQAVFLQRHWAPALAAAVIVVLVITLATVQYLQNPIEPAVLAELDESELEMIADIDLAEHYEIIRELDFFSDFEIIENLNGFEAS